MCCLYANDVLKSDILSDLREQTIKDDPGMRNLITSCQITNSGPPSTKALPPQTRPPLQKRNSTQPDMSRAPRDDDTQYTISKMQSQDFELHSFPKNFGTGLKLTWQVFKFYGKKYLPFPNSSVDSATHANSTTPLQALLFCKGYCHHHGQRQD